MFHSTNESSAPDVPDPQQIEAFLELLSEFGRVKLSLRDVAPRWSMQMQDDLRAAGMDVSANSEQIGVLRQFHRVFRILQAVPDGRSMGEISEQLGVSFSHATRTIEQMVQRKLLERHADAEDRRITRIRVTPGGEQVYRIFDDAFCRHLGQLLGQLSAEERRQLLTLGRRLFGVWSAAAQGYGGPE